MKVMMQFLAYGLFVGIIGFLSSHPDLRLMAADSAVVSVTFSHAGKRVGECKRLSQEELLALPPTMQMPDECPRERHPLQVEFLVDGDVLYKESVKPSGIWSDGKSTVYQRFELVAGRHQFDIRMNDSGESNIFDYQVSTELHLPPGKNLVLYFDEAAEQFVFE